MRVLVLGRSSIVRRRVLAALRAQPEVTGIGIASRQPVAAPEPDVDYYVGYGAALAAAPWDLVYISLPNALHALWARAALEQGCHVLVDKPAFLHRQEARDCLDLAERRGLLLAESVAWDAHPVWGEVEGLRAQFDCRWTHIAATFCFPPFPPGNFRYDPALGGGALFDLGPYAVSCARRFLGAPPQELAAQIMSRHPQTGVDTAFTLLARAGDVGMTGQFGFTSAYNNRLELIGDTASFIVEPAFTSTSEHVHALRYRGPAGEGVVQVAAADSFVRYLQRVLAALTAGEYGPERARLEQDMETMMRLRQAAGCEA
jgi:NDP-hexose-3-ketoreductase